MKPAARTILFAILLAIPLFLIGYFSWGGIFDFVLPIVGDVKYFESCFGSQFESSAIFGLTLALIPISAVLVWRFGHIIKSPQRILTVVIIIITIIASVGIRRTVIKSRAQEMKPLTAIDYSDPSFPPAKPIEQGIPVNTLLFEKFALAGLLTGSLISFFALRQKRKPDSSL